MKAEKPEPVFEPPTAHATELAQTLVGAGAADVQPAELDSELPPSLVPAGVIAEEVAAEQRARPASPWLDAVAHLLTLVVFALFIVTFIAQPFRIPSESMEPTLLIGDFVLVDKVAPAPAGTWQWLLPYEKPQRGQAVVFHYPVNPSEFLVKRIVGVPGDHIKLLRGHVFVNGAPQPDGYAVYLPSGPDVFRDRFPATDVLELGVEPKWLAQMHQLVRDGELVIPDGDYFVMGDNRNHSLDSRYWGFVPRANIAGTPALIYFSVRTPSLDEGLLPGASSDTMSRQPRGIRGFARWDRTLRVVR